MKSRSESDLSQPESDEEGYTLVKQTLSHTHTYTRVSHDIDIFVFMSCIPRDDSLCSDLKAASGFVSFFSFRVEGEMLTWTWRSLTKREVKIICRKIYLMLRVRMIQVFCCHQSYVTLVSLSSDSCVDSLFASFGAVEPQTQEELQASKRWHVSSSC